MRFSVFTREDPFSESVKARIVQDLSDHEDWKFDCEMPEIVICVGGDGTILRAIQKYIDRLDSVKFIGLHTGTLGFFTDYTYKEYSQFIQDLTTQEFKEEWAPLIQVEIKGYEKIYYAANEIRLGNFASTVRYNVYIDGGFFEQTTGTGICVSTQLGSTGANRALNGAVIENGFNVLQLMEIMPINHSKHRSLKNPFIMNPDRVIRIEGEDLKRSVAVCDYQEFRIDDAESLIIKTSDKKVCFARYEPYSYLKRLKNLY